MSNYENFIEKILAEEYINLKKFKDDDNSVVELFENQSNGKKLVRINSQNRNDEIFRALRGVGHANLPMIFDVCACETHLCVLEEFIDGKTLEAAMKSENISISSAVDYALDICNALSFLHSKRIIHRDVKPSNVMITPENKAVLIDLQAARFIIEKRVRDTCNLGTVGYAAPEQFGISQSLPPTDIYALGVMLNELVLGTHPSIETPKGYIGKIIKKCTDTQISKRYQTVDILAADLKKYKKFHRRYNQTTN